MNTVKQWVKEISAAVVGAILFWVGVLFVLAGLKLLSGGFILPGMAGLIAGAPALFGFRELWKGNY